MALEKGSEEWYMFMDYWNICKAFWDVQDSDDYWKGLIANLNVFLKKYNYDFFAKQLSFSLADYLEYKNKNKNFNIFIFSNYILYLFYWLC